MARRWVGIAATAVFAAGLGFTLLAGARSPSAPTPPRSPKTVRVEEATRAPATRPWRAHGEVRASDRAVLSFTVGGRVEARPVHVGTKVRAGEVLARLDARGFDHAARAATASLAESQARIAQLERDRRRLDALRGAAAATDEQVEKTDAALDSTRASRSALEAQVQEATRAQREAVLRAPFDGYVTETFLEPGEFASPGRPILAISGEGGVEVEVEAPETLSAQLRTGDPVTVDLPRAKINGLTGTITRVGQSREGGKRLYPVHVSLPASPGIRVGASAIVVFETPLPKGVTVPVSAVVAPSGDDPAVFRVENGRAERVPVELGELVGDRILLRGALAEADPVVVSGTLGLLHGQAVEVRR